MIVWRLKVAKVLCHLLVMSLTSCFFLPTVSGATQTRLSSMNPDQEIIPGMIQAIQMRGIETLAFWEFSPGPLEDEHALEDFELNLMYGLLDTDVVSVVDRKHLKSLLGEQQFGSSGLVEPSTMKHFGNLIGADAFVYGEVVRHLGKLHLVLKVVETDTASLVWMDLIRLSLPSKLTFQEEIVHDMVSFHIRSLKEVYLDGVETVTIWKTEIVGNDVTDGDETYFTDLLAASLVRETSYRYVDRTNIGRLLTEQELSIEGYVSPGTAKTIGKLYGIDAFVYARVYAMNNNAVSVSVRVMDVQTSSIRHADSNVIYAKSRKPDLLSVRRRAREQADFFVSSLLERDMGRIGTVGFAGMEGMTDVSGEMLQDLLLEALLSRGNLVLVDRHNIQDFLREQHFSQRGLVDPRKTKEMGKLYGVGNFLFLRAYEQSSSTAVIEARLVSTEQAVLVWADTYMQGKSWDLYTYQSIDEIASTLVSSFAREPRVKRGVETMGLLNTNNETNLEIQMDYLQTQLATQMIEAGYSTVDRRNMQLLISEQELAQDGLVDPLKATEVGRFLGIDAFVNVRFSNLRPLTTILTDSPEFRQLKQHLSKKYEVNVFVDVTDVDTGALLFGRRLSVAPPIPESTRTISTMSLIVAGEVRMPADIWGTSYETVPVDAYWLDKYEVTVKDFCEFLNAMGTHRDEETEIPWIGMQGRCRITKQEGKYQVQEGYARHPVTYVTWYGASAYAAWRDSRLPSEAEWKLAARTFANRRYPEREDAPLFGYEDVMSSEFANYGQYIGDTTPVGSYIATKPGLYDMAGNVWEWVSTSEMDWEGGDWDLTKTILGGGWASEVESLMNRSAGKYLETEEGSRFVGFRCARDAE